jgi:heme oxygenase
MFSEELKEQTKPAHQSLEKIIIRHIKAVQLPGDYEVLLQLFYSYYQPLEQVLDTFLDNDIVPHYSYRRKADSILHDIKQIAPDGRVKNLCSHLPAVNNIADALGALYVLEGSNLGGAVIAKMLSGQAGIPGHQLSFFTGYADKRMEMWKEFIAGLNMYAEKNGTGDAVIQAAKQTFEKFEQWAILFYSIPRGNSGLNITPV